MIKDELNYIEVKNSVAHAKIALQGAHIFEFQAQNKKPLLYLSETATFKQGKPIRGGIPICWPWFGPNSSNQDLPNHGFARTSLWTHEKTEILDEETTLVQLTLKSSPETKKLWPYDFKLSLEITISKELTLKLKTENLDTKSFTVSSALHTYFEIDNIKEVKIIGLENRLYYNKVDDSYGNVQEGNLSFKEEVDRVYQGVDNLVTIKDKEQDIIVNTEGSHTIVVWNPGEPLAAKMPDLHPYTNMVCVESANTLGDTLTIDPEQEHTITLRVSQEEIS